KCVLIKTPFADIHSYNASTIIIEYEKIESRLFSYLRENLSSYFKFSISLIAQDAQNNLDHINHEPDISIDINFKRDFNNLDCTNLNKEITNY
ncbi:hypothetical protein, partial [Flavobacterium beibuense]|uniref:hypothetical protein n=1 Tax=Flavobacterium beibuense TaxID=657326 RepID=UPI003A947B29